MDNIDLSYKIYIVSKYGTIEKSILNIFRKEVNLEAELTWRSAPKTNCELSCKFSYIKSISLTMFDNAEFVNFFHHGDDIAVHHSETPQINFLFADFKLTIQLVELDQTQAFFDLLLDLHQRAMKISYLEKEYNAKLNMQHQQSLHRMKSTTAVTSSSNQQQQVALARQRESESNLRQEQLLQMTHNLKMKEGYMVIDNFRIRYLVSVLNSAFRHWVYVIRDTNETKMIEDRHRWRLHATANQEIDLQAWYHALFYQEVYRLRGYFWYKDALLPSYRHSYDLVDNGLTPLEEAALAHVLCSPDTTYGDVAGQMFIVQAILTERQFKLFQQLAAQGTQIIKYPRTGRPAKKHFRFSFVEGNIYLTWKGKFGNQGVGMGEITNLCKGIQTDVLRWSGQTAKADQYLSIICSDRSIDLFFDTEEERNDVHDMLKALVAKEQGKLQFPDDPFTEIITNCDMQPVAGNGGSATIDDFDRIVLYSSIAKNFV